MKKLLVLLMSVGLLMACNNNKPANNANTNNREKDDYRNNTDANKDNQNTNTNTNDRNKENADNNHDQNNSGGWSKAEEADWLKQCTDPLIEKMGEERTHTYCNCMLEKLKVKFPTYEEANTKGTYDDGVQIGGICLKEMGLQPNQ